ncbi:FkbM family methyltransferase [Microcoleus sp. Pol14C2]|uniref:FkbM family methyltransferase n=1 Tax=unclassified Microcoleus TaxID=2642155 RepID=UPI002FD3DA46
MSLFLPSLKRSGHLDRIHMTVCNVGSRKVTSEDDYSQKGWEIFAPHLTIYGFDVDADACEASNTALEAQPINYTEKHIPLALANSVGESTLYVTKDPMCSSLYPPNEPYIERFSGLPELVNLDFYVGIETTTLDEFCKSEGIEEIDFLQIDVQGAELQVLQGASQILGKSILAVQAEVEFSHLYKNQPLFADVDIYLREQGFTLFDLDKTSRLRSISPIRSTVRAGQLLDGEAFYFRDLIDDSLENNLKTPERILKLACIADILNFPDYTLELLEYLTFHYGSNPDYNFANNIVESLAQFSELVNKGLTSLPAVSRILDYIDGYDIDSLIPSEADITTKDQQELPIDPMKVFHCDEYLRHNQRRLEHLASLGLDFVGKTVLELGAGIGDHTSFFLDRSCEVVAAEGRPQNLEILRARYPDIEAIQLDIDTPDLKINQQFDIVYCYGLLYHLQTPTQAIEFMARSCQNMLLLETSVSFGEEEAINFCKEEADYPSQAISGNGCRPTRKWVYNQLKQYFEFVYMPITQPNHEQFPIDWTLSSSETLVRSVFIASRQELNNILLLEDIPLKQQRH